MGKGGRAFTVEEAARLTGVSATTIRYWAGPRSKVLKAEIADAGVRGSRKLLSTRNMMQIRTASDLSQAGWPQWLIARELPHIFRHGDWFDTGSKLPRWLVFADRKAWGNQCWTFEEIWRPGRPELSTSGWALSHFLADVMDAETATFTWADGFEPTDAAEQQDLKSWRGIKKLTIINLRVIAEHITNA